MSRLIRFTRHPLGEKLVGWIFTHMTFALPVKRLRETPTLIAFHHPQPSYPLHILMVPKRAIPSLSDIKATDADLLADLMQVTQSLVVEFRLEEIGYRLIVNGGKYQDVPQLHFHLVSEKEP